MKLLNTSVLMLLLLWGGTLFAKPVTISKVKSKKPRLFLITIGVNNYEDDFFPDLKWAERDADRVARELGKDTGYEVERKVLTGASVTRDAIRTELQALATRASSSDAFLIYVSSHGTLVTDGDGDLEPVVVLPSTDSKSLAKTTLPLAVLMKWIDRIPANRKFLMTAACYSGVGKSRLTPEMQERLARAKGSGDLILASEGTVVLSAAARTEVAVEDNKFRSDVYTHFFLGALSVYDRNQDGAVSVLEAHDYATEMAYKYSRGRQRPTIKAEVIGSIDIPLRGRSVREGLPVLTGYDERFSGLEIEVNQQPKGRLPFAFPLKQGRNEVTLLSQDGEEIVGRFTLKAREGETVSVEDLLAGHPFAAGFYFASMQPTTRTFRKLTDGQVQTTGLFGRYRRDRFELGLGIQLPVEYEAEILGGLKASSRQSGFGVRPGIRLFGIGAWSAVADLVIGIDEVNLRIADSSTGYTKEASSRALLSGAGVGMYWNIMDAVLLSLTSSYERAKHDFDSFGKVDMSRRQTIMGVRFTFGGKARRR